MDISTAILSLYLLFSTFTPAQGALETKVHGTDMSRAEKLNTRMEVRNYIAAEKIRILLGAQISESDSDENQDGEGIGGIENPKYGPQSGGMTLDLVLGNSGATEVLYKNALERIAFFQYGEEYFAAPDTLTPDRHSIVSVNDSTFSRTEYDRLYRMMERTVWKNGKSSASTYMKSRTRYTYSGDWATIPRFFGEEDFENNTYREVRYSATGKPTEVVDYDVGKGSGGGVRRILKKKNSYTYDRSDRLVIDVQLENFDDGTSKSTKNIYTYTALASVPNVSYYEDGVLRIQTTYKSDSDYTQTVFFDEGFSISTEYRNGERVLEVTYFGETEMSRRTF
ncbi:MAG: hypothetical protein IIU15_03140 [Treponema sp.]|nr:hypothetical protein [Treponema sp.]